MNTPFSRIGQGQQALALLCLVVAIAGCNAPEPPLPVLKIDPARVTVSGISSGAYMAHQVHLAYSTRIAGAGLIAGGPYACAAGQLDRALKICTQTVDSGPDVSSLIERAQSRAQSGAIDPLTGLAGDRIWTFHGEADTTVVTQVSAAIAPLYAGLSDAVDVVENTRPGIAHTFPTDAYGGECDKSDAPYLGRCDFDAAGEIFRRVVQTEGAAADTSSGILHRFGQDALLEAGDDAQLARAGFLYVPNQCRDGVCGLHLAFHGCQQSVERIGNEFVEHAGYNRWADLANVVVIYPQVRSSWMPLNPKGCWDWWGYSGDNYDTRKGKQIAWVGQLLDHFGVR